MAIFMASSSPALAELYSWVDDEGVIHLTNIAPSADYKPYLGEDAEGFGGEQPLVLLASTGNKRVLYKVNVGRFDDTLREAAAFYRLPFSFLKAVAKVESNFNPRARSHAGAKGLMQLIDGTAREQGARVRGREPEVAGGGPKGGVRPPVEGHMCQRRVNEFIFQFSHLNLCAEGAGPALDKPGALCYTATSCFNLQL